MPATSTAASPSALSIGLPLRSPRNPCASEPPSHLHASHCSTRSAPPRLSLPVGGMPSALDTRSRELARATLHEALSPRPRFFQQAARAVHTATGRPSRREHAQRAPTHRATRRVQDPRERPDALTLASTFTKLATVLQEADAQQEAPPAAALAAGVLGKVARGSNPEAREDALEDALLDGTLDVDLLRASCSINSSADTGAAAHYPSCSHHRLPRYPPIAPPPHASPLTRRNRQIIGGGGGGGSGTLYAGTPPHVVAPCLLLPVFWAALGASPQTLRCRMSPPCDASRCRRDTPTQALRVCLRFWAHRIKAAQARPSRDE